MTDSPAHLSNSVYKTFVLLSLLCTSYANIIIPKQFLRDNAYYEQRIGSKTSGYNDSFQVIVDLYKFLQIEKSNMGTRIASWLVFYIALAIVRSKFSKKFNSLRAESISIIYLIFIPFYGSQFSKEFLVIILLIVTLLALNMIPDKKNLIVLVIFQLAIAILIRQYYFITVIATFFFILLRNRSKLIKLLAPILVIAVGAFVNLKTNFSEKLFNVNLFEIRNVINANSVIKANTMIFQDPYTTNIFENFLNYIKVIGRIIFPVNVFNWTIYSYGIFLTSIILSSLIIVPYFQKKLNTIFEPSFLIAYFFTATIFEPDLGSFSRHTFIYLLLVLRIIYLSNSKNLLTR